MQSEKELLKMPKHQQKKRTLSDIELSDLELSIDNMDVDDDVTKNTNAKLQELSAVPTNKQIMEGISSMFTLMSSSHTKITQVEKKITKLDLKLLDQKLRIDSIEKTTDLFREDVDKNTASVNYFKQKEIDNKVMISGFQTLPDNKTVPQSILNLYEMNDSTYSSYTYQRTVTTEDGNKISVPTLVIEFNKKSDQIELISKKKEKGPIMLKQLFHNGGDKKLKIVSILTAENVKIQKKLRSLHEDDLIKQINYKNCTFVIKISPTSPPLPINTSDQAEALSINLRTKNLRNPNSIQNPSTSKNTSK